MLALTHGAIAHGADAPVFRNPTFEELAEITIVSVARKAEPYFSVPAAVYVLSGDDIRRSGARTLPEALRLVPGVEVARIAPHRYAVGMRGFNREFTNKLLVLQDGRYLYTPLFAGTFWDMQDTFLEDVDRIEIVRGPGGTAWGVNAVNGVINIVTKRAKDTEGIVVSVGGGDEERAFGGVRYGGEVGATAFRAFLQSAYRDEGVFTNGASAKDSWRQTRFGFRTDSELSEQDTLTLHGEAYDGRSNELVAGGANEVDVNGQYALVRWEHRSSANKDLSLQAYYDTSERDTFQGTSDRREWLLEAIARTPLLSRHDLTYGLSYRGSRNKASAIAGLSFSPPVRVLAYTSAYLDDAIHFLDDRLLVSAGIKAEHNDFTHTEWLPNARIRFQLTEEQVWWAAITRGARLPAITDNDATFILPGLQSLPNVELPAEEVYAFEAGWRMRDREHWSADISTYYNDYDRLRTRETTFVSTPPTIVRRRDSKLAANSYGVETTLTTQLLKAWRLQVNASYLDVDLHLAPESTDLMLPDSVGLSPHWQASLRNTVSFGAHWEGSVFYRYVGPLMRVAVPGYHDLNVRLAWRPMQHWEIAVVGQNLLRAHHLEIPGQSGQPAGSEVERSVFVHVRWEH